MIEFNNILHHICKNKRRKLRNIRNYQLKVPLYVDEERKINSSTIENRLDLPKFNIFKTKYSFNAHSD